MLATKLNLTCLFDDLVTLLGFSEIKRPPNPSRQTYSKVYNRNSN